MASLLADFCFQVLWDKLKVAERLSSWTKNPKCPICGINESISHALSLRRFHVVCFDALEKGRAPVQIGEMQHSARTLPKESSFTHPLGIMTSTALAAHWSPRNSMLRGVASLETFLNIWIQFVGTVMAWEPLAKFSAAFQQFYTSLVHQRNHGFFPHQRIEYQASTDEQEERAAKQQKRHTRKKELALKTVTEISNYESEGYTMVYTDGSAKWVQGVGWVGGWGCHSPTG